MAKRKKSSHLNRLHLLVFALLSSLLLITNSNPIPSFDLTNKAKESVLAAISDESARDSIQLKTLEFSTAPPTPQSTTPPQPEESSWQACNHDNGLPAVNTGKPFDTNCYCSMYLVTCENKECQDVQSFTSPKMDCSVVGDWCKSQQLVGEGNGVFCLGKPVIYLYPTQKTIVDVKVTFKKGAVVVSDPQYDYTFKGWKNVTAYPDSTLIYQNKKYKELFYETATTAVSQPNECIIIPTSNLKPELTRLTSKLGLINHEQTEFLYYWIPLLEKLNSPYILFSLISQKEKEEIDQVTITPKPDVFINFLAYFKPLEKPIDINPLVIPEPPKRQGFTAVEWGGTIDHN